MNMAGIGHKVRKQSSHGNLKHFRQEKGVEGKRIAEGNAKVMGSGRKRTKESSSGKLQRVDRGLLLGS